MTLAFITWREIFLSAVSVVDAWVLATLGLYAGCYLFQMVTALIEARRSQRQVKTISPWWMLSNKVTLPISLCVPAYNEEKTIVDSLRSLLALHYPDFEVIVCNDGSKDKTLQVLIDAFELKPSPRVYTLSVPCKPLRGVYSSPRFPRLTVIDKENGGKSDAINGSVNLSRNPLVCVVDADSLLEPDALLRLVRPFIAEPEEMVAVGGKIRVVNGCEVRSGRVVQTGIPKQLLPLLQTVEYIRSFQIARLSWSQAQCVTIISGAFGLFKRSAVIEIGGFLHNTVGEDMELTVRLHRHYRDKKVNYKIRYLPDAICWTEVPANLKILRAQRSRWARGMLEVLYRHRAMIFSPRYGSAGVFGLGYFFVFDAIGPIIECLGYLIIPTCWLAGMLNTPFFLAYMGLLFAFGVFVSVGSLFLEELTTSERTRPRDLVILALAAFIENFGYRQLNTLWRLESWYQFIRKKRGWGTMVRAGFTKQAAQRPA